MFTCYICLYRNIGQYIYLNVLMSNLGIVIDPLNPAHVEFNRLMLTVIEYESHLFSLNIGGKGVAFSTKRAVLCNRSRFTLS